MSVVSLGLPLSRILFDSKQIQYYFCRGLVADKSFVYRISTIAIRFSL